MSISKMQKLPWDLACHQDLSQLCQTAEQVLGIKYHLLFSFWVVIIEEQKSSL